ncbi:TetR/AcrR family transcriptional regulator [Mangrovihabitans endophyticus]|uniref:TetR family transcriptional regulator n=1 Tax=Mangrovihabitans endophyticus TaxID=1751298 RepID=A0A8J3C6Z7_9ACTN|nr:TetR/AcrR family transcriptional regulator [Mangrovihabitans endophyticus]GGL13630.1 TetR family transcriptional regulator [Mangrovihabitans endophyticus]
MAGTDRRVRRTRRALQQALVSLVIERGYERTTVQEVLDRADVGRTTFYAHFRDKDALFASCFDDLAEELRTELAAMQPGLPPADPVRPIGVVFGHAHRHREVYRAICRRPQANPALAFLHRQVADLLREHLSDAGARMPVDVMAEYHAGALLALLIWWVTNDFPYGPDEIARLCQTMMAPAVMAGLRDGGPHGLA